MAPRFMTLALFSAANYCAVGAVKVTRSDDKKGSGSDILLKNTEDDRVLHVKEPPMDDVTSEPEVEEENEEEEKVHKCSHENHCHENHSHGEEDNNGDDTHEKHSHAKDGECCHENHGEKHSHEKHSHAKDGECSHENHGEKHSHAKDGECNHSHGSQKEGRPMVPFIKLQKIEIALEKAREAFRKAASQDEQLKKCDNWETCFSLLAQKRLGYEQASKDATAEFKKSLRGGDETEKLCGQEIEQFGDAQLARDVVQHFAKDDEQLARFDEELQHWREKVQKCDKQEGLEAVKKWIEENVSMEPEPKQEAATVPDSPQTTEGKTWFWSWGIWVAITLALVVLVALIAVFARLTGPAAGDGVVEV